MENDNIENVEVNTDAVSTEESNSLLNTTAETAPVVEQSTENIKETSAFDKMSDFIKTLDPVLQEHKSWQKFKTPQDLAKSYTELEKLVGKKGDIPKDDATPEEWKEFYKKLGNPDTINEYDITLPEELKEGEERFNKALELAHEIGLNKTQANKLFNGLFEMEKEELNLFTQVQSQTLREEESKLKEAWGDAMDDMAESVTRFEKSLGVYELFERKGLNADADLLIMLGQLASRLGEDPTIKSNMSNTPAGIDNEISEVASQIKEYLKKGEKVPQHLTNRRKELFERKFRD